MLGQPADGSQTPGFRLNLPWPRPGELGRVGWTRWVRRKALPARHAQLPPTTPPSRPLPVQIIQVSQCPGMTWGPWFRARGGRGE